MTAKGRGRGKHRTIQAGKRHKTFEFEFSPRYLAKYKTATSHHNTATNQQSTAEYACKCKDYNINMDGETQTKLQQHRKGGDRQMMQYQKNKDCIKTNHTTNNTLHIHHQRTNNFQTDVSKLTSGRMNKIL